MLVTDAPVRPREIIAAARLLEEGELVGLPTETVYGLAADAENDAAVARIYAAKGRPADHPVIVHVHRNADPSRWASDIDARARRLMDAFWPGPLTLVLRRRPGVAEGCAGGQDTIALRCPDHPVAQAVLAVFKGGQGGLAAPSANRFGRISPTTAEHVRAELGDAVALVLDGGPCAVGIESTIVDCSHEGRWPRILRPGGVSARALADVLGCSPDDLVARPRESAPRVPGALASHYAPSTPLRLMDASAIDAAWVPEGRMGVLAPRPEPRPDPRGAWLAAPADAEGYAHALYAALRTLDGRGLDVIWVERPPSDPAWDAVRDRLRRAAADTA